MAGVETKPLIDKLPEEMLAKIFSMLEVDDLKVVATVQKSWNKLVGEHPHTMKKMKLHLKIEDEQGWNKVFKESKNLVRRYHSARIEDAIDSWNKHAMNTLKNLGAHLHLLELVNCEFSVADAKIVTKIFRSLGELESLKMYDVDLDAVDESELVSIKPPDMDKLKSLVMHESSWGMLEFFKKSQLISLKISGSLCSDMEHYLINYLVTQKKLEELALRDLDFRYSSIEASQIEKLNFPLKKLALHLQKDFLNSEENAKAFLGRFANTLEQLELGGKFESSFYAYVFEKLEKLKCLDLNAGGLPKDENFYKTLKNLPSVKKLMIDRYKAKHQPLVQGIIGNLQDVETLIIAGDVSNKLMLFIANNLHKLKSLEVGSFTGNMFNKVKMPESLKKFSVTRLGSVSGKNWAEICSAMPTLEEFSVISIRGDLSFNEAKFNAFTRNWHQLRVLNIGFGFAPKPRMFSYLLKRCPKIHTVRIASGCEISNPAFENFKKNGLRLILGNPYETGGNIDGEVDTSLWSGEEAQGEFNEEDSESDDDSDGLGPDLDMEQLGMLFGGLLGEVLYDPDREDMLYFDSDGEMRYWDEGPEDYGFELY